MAYAEAVGGFLAAYRRRHGITLEAIATVGRDYGATWSLSSVQAIERGKAAPTVPTLLTLALALGKLSGEPLRLADLLGAAELLERPYELREDQPVRREWVNRVLSGAPIALEDGDYAHVGAAPIGGDHEWDEELEMAALEHMRVHGRKSESYDQVDAQWGAMTEVPDRDTRQSARRPSVSLAESRAAKKLGMRPPLLQQYAARLWGHSLEAEALLRAGEDSTPQARGRVTRVLIDELRASTDGEV